MYIPHYNLVSPEDANPKAWVLLLHGIYGSGANWRTFARRLVGRREDWGVVLLDMRMHGRSQEARPPHTLSAMSGDLSLLVRDLTDKGVNIRATIGHSFGGKVVTQYRARAADSVKQTWLIESSPSAKPGGMDDPENMPVKVLNIIQQLPRKPFKTRDEFIGQFTKHGFDRKIGNWLAMNLDRAPGGFTFRLQPSAMRDLLTDYYDKESWTIVEDPHVPGEVFVVIGGKSDTVSAEDQERFLKAEKDLEGKLSVHRFEESGHWVHVDALYDLVDLVAEKLPVIEEEE